MTAPERVEIRREWRVQTAFPDSPSVFAHTLYDAAGADRFAAIASRDFRTGETWIEEREITTRVVSRRVVPRTTEGGEGNG